MSVRKMLVNERCWKKFPKICMIPKIPSSACSTALRAINQDIQSLFKSPPQILISSKMENSVTNVPAFQPTGVVSRHVVALSICLTLTVWIFWGGVFKWKKIITNPVSPTSKMLCPEFLEHKSGAVLNADFWFWTGHLLWALHRRGMLGQNEYSSAFVLSKLFVILVENDLF